MFFSSYVQLAVNHTNNDLISFDKLLEFCKKKSFEKFDYPIELVNFVLKENIYYIIEY